MNPNRFIHSFTHYRAKNNKIKDLFPIVDKLDQTLVTGENPIKNLVDYLKAQCAELDRKYPRTRPFIVRCSASGYVAIYSGDPDKAQIESGHIAVSFRATPIRQTVQFNDGKVIVKQGGGDAV